MMPIINVRDNENNRCKTNAKKTKTKKNTQKNKQAKKTENKKGDKSYSERVRAKRYCCALNLGFLQLICKASLICKSNLELALSIIIR